MPPPGGLKKEVRPHRVTGVALDSISSSNLSEQIKDLNPFSPLPPITHKDTFMNEKQEPEDACETADEQKHVLGRHRVIPGIGHASDTRTEPEYGPDVAATMFEVDTYLIIPGGEGEELFPVHSFTPSEGQGRVETGKSLGNDSEINHTASCLMEEDGDSGDDKGDDSDNLSGNGSTDARTSLAAVDTGQTDALCERQTTLDPKFSGLTKVSRAYFAQNVNS